MRRSAVVRAVEAMAIVSVTWVELFHWVVKVMSPGFGSMRTRTPARMFVAVRLSTAPLDPDP